MSTMVPERRKESDAFVVASWVGHQVKVVIRVLGFEVLGLLSLGPKILRVYDEIIFHVIGLTLWALVYVLGSYAFINEYFISLEKKK